MAISRLITVIVILSSSYLHELDCRHHPFHHHHHHHRHHHQQHHQTKLNCCWELHGLIRKEGLDGFRSPVQQPNADLSIALVPCLRKNGKTREDDR